MKNQENKINLLRLLENEYKGAAKVRCITELNLELQYNDAGGLEYLPSPQTPEDWRDRQVEITMAELEKFERERERIINGR